MMSSKDSVFCLAPLPNPAKPLPQVPGPKLAPFTRTGHAVIHFVQELGNPARDRDSRVWKVKINGKEQFYALKMFMFDSVEYLRDEPAAALIRDFASPQLWVDFFDAFNSECRAYGRLREEKREDLAVRAYGYLLLAPQQEAEVARRSTGKDYKPVDAKTELDGGNPWGRYEEHRHLPIRAIVKDFIDHDVPFSPSQVPDMWKDLEDLHKLGILVRDIHVFNYIGGKLIDFSRSWTTPHPSFVPTAMRPKRIKRARERDPQSLRKAIVEWGIGNDWDWDEVVIPEELTNCASGRGQNDCYGQDPRLYPWLKWEKDPDAAKALMENGIFTDAWKGTKGKGW